MLFREHRGGLAESMATTVEVKTVFQFLKHVVKIHPGISDTGGELKVESYSGPDDRIGWKDCWIVTKGDRILGFTDGPLPRAFVDVRVE